MKKVSLNGLTPKILLVILVVITSTGLTIAIHSLTRGNMLGYDFFYYWNTARAFAQEGLYPHSDEVAVQNQMGLYGHPARNGEDPSHFKNPIYTVFFLIPISYLPYDWAQAVWIVCFILAVFACFLTVFRKLPPGYVFSFIFFYQVGFCLVMGNFSLPAALTILFSLGYLFIQADDTRRNQILCGLLLIIATFKPQFSWLFILFILIMALKKRWIPFLVAFFAPIVAGSLYMLIRFPTWPRDFLSLMSGYYAAAHITPVRYLLTQSILPQSAGFILGNLVLGIAGILTLVVLARYFKMEDRRDLPLLASLIALTTYLAHPSGYSTEQIILVIPALVWVVLRRDAIHWAGWVWLGWFLLSYLVLLVEQIFPGHTLIIKLPFLINTLWTIFVWYDSRRMGVRTAV